MQAWEEYLVQGYLFITKVTCLFWIIVPKPQDYWKKYVSHYIDGTFNSAFFMDKDWVSNLLLS